MPAANNRIVIDEVSITDTAHNVAASLAAAAKPGPLPRATGASPIDGAAASIAVAIAAQVAASSAHIAPHSAEALSKTQAALAMMKGQDAENAGEIRAVSATLAGADAQQNAGVQGFAGDPREDWNNFQDGSEPVPVRPGGAGPGLDVLPGGVPAELVNYSTDDWFYGDDEIDRLPGPIGAGPGPSVIPGTGIPDELI